MFGGLVVSTYKDQWRHSNLNDSWFIDVTCDATVCPRSLIQIVKRVAILKWTRLLRHQYTNFEKEDESSAEHLKKTTQTLSILQRLIKTIN